MLVRHPLQSRWTLWYLEADRNKEWEDCLKCSSLFDTVVDSRSQYNGMTVASFRPTSSCSLKEGFVRSAFFDCQAENCYDKVSFVSLLFPRDERPVVLQWGSLPFRSSTN
ncbi:hypothetical protein PRIPAC_75824 [Pristionchus pacificus]|uniref:Uncharacterized protein n=1 Tax=Pristionchus pacificus TaxID=54126 RepID=A0A454XIY4_PRIPA|nr:hypothetical protein PRIPAC_75824 [Pristionchus pacificus]|eukprot:PDM83625.1 hypothetical protein PRIPAC_30112 [Pristionchus pacificus]